MEKLKNYLKEEIKTLSIKYLLLFLSASPFIVENAKALEKKLASLINIHLITIIISIQRTDYL